MHTRLRILAKAIPFTCLLSVASSGYSAVSAQQTSSFEEVERRVTEAADAEELRPLAHQLLELAEVSNDTRELVVAYRTLATAYHGRDEPERADGYADLGLEHAGNAANLEGEVRYLLHMKALILLRLGRPEEALEYANQSYQLATEIGSREALLQTTQSLANLHGRLGNHSESLKYHLESLGTFDMDDTVPRLQVFSNVILLLIRMGDLDRALEYSDQAEALRGSMQEVTDEAGRTGALLLLNRANLLRLLERYDEQLIALEEADRLSKEYPAERTSNLITSALADAYINLGDYDRAIDYSRRALVGVDRDERPYPYAIAITNLGLALSKSGRYSQGIRYLEEAREIFEEIQSRSEALELQGLVAEAYEEAGNYVAALAAHKRFKQSTDEHNQAQIQSQLGEARAEFDVTLAEGELELLEAQRQLQELVIGRQRLVAFSAAVALMAALVILALGWNRYRLKTRAYEALSVAHEKLDRALEEVRTLQGMLPICANCKKVRDDQGLWSQVESYISTHSDAEFSHTVCPDCMKELYPDYTESQGLDATTT